MNCHLCSEKYKHVYYKDYTELDKHFCKSHYACLNEACKEKCFVVFGTLEEFQLHNHREHGAGTTKQYNAFKIGLFSGGDEIEKKADYRDGIGSDYTRFFDPDYYTHIQEEYKRKQVLKSAAQKSSYVHPHEPQGKPTTKWVKKQPEIIATKKPVAPSTKLPLDHCIENLRNQVHILIKRQYDAMKEGAVIEFKMPKEQLFQMNGLIDGLSLEGMSQLEYIMNFGISLKIKKFLGYIIRENNGDINDEEEIQALDFKEQLVIYKYLDIAVQKNREEIHQDGPR
eukprot:TRINITY_DN17198_c0_g1_i5.p1 TRINITY_DN17198_c0_g1~~TRINITY_DN17198_c0_g1_i5.p1  ORF type:complete len:283 (-),score=50.63 TRINITY_DN17198_c0_g1_i5:587-1435(-)